MDSQQQFCLKWNSFGSNLATVFSNLFKSESLADVTLFCEGVSFRAHKLILAACSKHLADLFETAPLFQNVLVILDGTSAANMSALLEFMYKGEVHVSQESLSSFLKAAEYLQVKGLSIEHEKLAVAQSQHAQEASLDSPTSRKHSRLSSSGSKDECDTPHSLYHPAPSPSSYSPAMSPYMQPHHYRSHETRINSQTVGANISNERSYDSPRKRPLRSPSEMLLQEAAAVRASVLRDGSKAAASRPGSPVNNNNNTGPLSLAYRPSSSSSSSLPPQPDSDAQPEHKYEPPEPTNSTSAAATSTFDRTTVVKTENTSCSSASAESRRHSADDSSFPEGNHQHNGLNPPGLIEYLKNPKRFLDLRMKMDSTNTSQPEDMVTNSRGGAATPTGVSGSASGNGNSTSGGGGGNYTSANGTSLPPTNMKFDCDGKIIQPELLPANLWNSVTGKLSHKAGSITTPDGKKLKCPFCERLYGYETNLRAHIRQRHQGIRVPCPFCSRTFTRNNTVRRHIAREHKTELSLKTFQQTQQAQQQQVHNHNQ